MSDTSQNIVFPGSGLDTDSAYQYMGMGDSPYRIHCMHGTDGNNGVIEIMKGNHLSRYDLNNSNCYQVNGSYYNRLSRKCYFFIFSQPYNWSLSGDYEYDNRLLCFDEDSEIISLIFLDTKNYFGLDLNYPVKDCDMLGDYLYFNTRISEPKMIDVVRAKNYTDYDVYDSLTTYSVGDKIRYYGGIFVANAAIAAGETPSTHATKWDRIGDCYQDESNIFDSEFRYAFNILKHIPVYRPVYNFGTDTNKNANNVRGKIFRFSYRYKYFDNTYSKFSAYSAITLPEYNEYYNGEVTADLDFHNYIGVTVDLHSAALIKEIEIIFQEIGQDWKKAKVVNRWEQALLDDYLYIYKFYNTDSAYDVIDQTLLNEVYDSVPRTAATQELINKNILAYGRCKMGFDNLDKDLIDVTLTPEIEAISIGDTSTLVLDLFDMDGTKYWDLGVGNDWVQREIDGFLLWVPDGDGYVEAELDIDDFFSLLQAGDVFELSFEETSAVYTFTAPDVAAEITCTLSLYNFILTNFPTIDSVTTLGHSVYVREYGDAFIIKKSLIYRPLGVPETALTKKGGFKTGAWHPFCIYYYDDPLRRGDAQTSKENIDGSGYSINGTTVYVPMFNEYSPPLDTANRWKMNWSVNHLPPNWAKWWRWGKADVVPYFVQYVIEEVSLASPWVRMNIRPLQEVKTAETAGWNQFPHSIIEPYAWVKGDRVRIITEQAAGGNLGDTYDGVLDFEIVKYDDTTDADKYWIYTQNFTTTDIGAGSLIEIYRPNASDDVPTLFYEFGEIMPIKEDSSGVMVHSCGITGTQDQSTTLGLPATGVFEYGDVYHILRTPSYPISTIEGYFHESQWYSDFYTSDDWSKGRPGVESSIGERTLNIIQFSKQYLQNTGVNGLSTFKAGDYRELNDIYGNIVAMLEVGNTLKVYMEKKSASILIGRQEYVDAQGQTTIATSDRVFGSIRYSESNFGTQWIESVSKSNRFVYGFDVFNGVMWRDSANGIFPISGRYEDAGVTGDYKMETWFRDKAEALTASGIEYIKVMTVWDERYKCLYVVFRDIINSDNDTTIVFHEPSNRWITFADFTQTPEDGYNVMLELDYWVLDGFELGIGFSFDEDTRFAVFDIATSSNINVPLGLLELEFEVLEPTVSVTPVIPVALPSTGQTTSSWIANWLQSMYATGYNLEYDTDPGFGTAVTVDVGNVTTYEVSALPESDAKVYYFYRISAYNADYTSNTSNEITTYLMPTIPLAPGIIPSVNHTGTSFIARWNHSVSTETAGYYLDVASDNAFANILSGFNNFDVGYNNLKLITGLTPGITYYYRLRTYDSESQVSINSATGSGATLTVPDAPVAYSATDVTYSSFTARWNAVVGASEYRVDVSTDIAFGSFVTGWNNKITGPYATSISVTGLDAYTTYYYRVRASGGGGISDNSSTIEVTTSYAIPSIPLPMEATDVDYSSFTANWHASTGATGYYIDVASDSAFLYMVSGWENYNVLIGTSQSITGLPYSGTYYYRVRAYNLEGVSDSSGTAAVVLLT